MSEPYNLLDLADEANADLMDGTRRSRPSKEEIESNVSQEFIKEEAIKSKVSEEDLTQALQLLDGQAEPDVSQYHRLIAIDRASGLTVDEISVKYDMSIQAANSLCSQKWFASLVLKIQSSTKTPLLKRLKQLAPIALEKRALLMMTTTDPKLLEVLTKDFLDRELGKAVTKIESSNLNFNVSEDSSRISVEIESIEKQINLIQQQRKLLAS